MSRQVIGMMEGAYFLPQSEIIGWLNSFYGFQITKVEEACTGAIYCQVIDSLFPGKVPLHKVNFDARFDYEWVANYKVLQTSFDQLQIQKSIDCQALMKGKRMDNLEFLQWLKRYFDLNHKPEEEYDAVAIREEARAQFYKNKKIKPPPQRGSGGNVSRKPMAKTSPSTKTSSPKTTTTSSPKTTTTSSSPSGSKPSSRRPPPTRPTDKENKTKTNISPSTNNPKLEEEIKTLKGEVTELSSTLQSMEKERDFYYAKLREIELLCQNTEMSAFVRSVEDIMYAE